MKLATRIFLCSFLVYIGLVGCSSTSHSTRDQLLVPQTIQAPKSVPKVLALYKDSFIEILEGHGFVVGETNDPDALKLVFAFNGNPFKMRVTAELWQKGVPVLSASSLNAGWGTGISRGGAVADLTGRVLTEFEKELDVLLVNTKIKPATASSTSKSQTSPDKDIPPSSSSREIVKSIGESMFCTESFNLLRKSKESETWQIRCDDNELMEVRCFEGDCYIKQ